MCAQESEAQLVESCRAGDQEAWTALVARFDGVILAIAARHGLSEDESLDVLQETFFTLLLHLDDLDEPARLPAWMATTARRASLKRLRSRRMYRERAGRSLGDEEPSAPVLDDEELLLIERRQRVFAGMDRLSRRCRDLLMLLYGPDAGSYQEAARRLDVPLGSIGPTRARCLDQLKRLLD